MTGMQLEQKPVLVRRLETDDSEHLAHRGRLRSVQALFLIIGLSSLGYYGYLLASQNIYEAYENWAFDHQIAGSSSVHFVDYLRQQTPVGWLLGPGEVIPSAPVRKSTHDSAFLPPAQGAVLGRIVVPRLHIEAMVREGVTSAILSQAVGHVPSTALAGQSGNFAIAAHRDTLFRALKDVQKGDLVTFQSPDGIYTYRISLLRIVKPTEVSVLRPDGAISQPAVQGVTYQANSLKLITLITCYPFFYVGSAPERFIVQGQLVAQDSPPRPPSLQTRAGPAQARPPRHTVRIRQTAKFSQPRSKRGFSHLRTPAANTRSQPALRKRPFWKGLFRG